MSFMSYFVLYCKLFICKLLRIDYLGLGREISLPSLLVLMWFLFGGFLLPLGAWDRLRYFYCSTPWAAHMIILD